LDEAVGVEPALLVGVGEHPGESLGPVVADLTCGKAFDG